MKLSRNLLPTFALAALLGLAGGASAQVGIGTPSPNASAMLEVRAANKGMLLPQVALASLSDAATVPAPATSLLVYNTNAGLPGGVGFYYNAGSPALPAWVQLATSTTPTTGGWLTAGNAGTTPATQFLGTTDAQDLAFRTAGTERLRLTQAGALSLTAPNNATIIGHNAGAVNTGADNQFIGYEAGKGNTTGQANTYIGYQAGRNGTAAEKNVFIGYRAGAKNVLPGQHFVGYRAGESNLVGQGNHFDGHQAGMANVSGNGNHFSGRNAGSNNTSGHENLFVGLQAGLNNSNGDGNTYIGHQAGQAGTAAEKNVFIGYRAGFRNVLPGQHFVGYRAGENNLVGQGNHFDGHQAGMANVSGNGNHFSGRNAGSNNTSGDDNLFVGLQAGLSNVKGDNNTLLGYNADVDASNLTNAAAIGANAHVGASNAMVLGGTGANAVNVGINTTTPTARLEVNGTVKLGTNGTRLNEIIKMTLVKNVAPIGANASGIETFTVAGAAPNSTVYISPDLDLADGLLIAYARVSAPNTVIVKFQNTTNAAINTANQQFHLTVIR